MARKKEKDIGSIIAAARKLRADMNSVARDMRDITKNMVLSIIKGSKRRGRPPKLRRARPSKALKGRRQKRKRGRPPKAKKVKPPVEEKV